MGTLVSSGGKLWGWGLDPWGTGNAAPHQAAPFPGVADVESFYTNGYGTYFALKSDGTLWAWGRNDSGLLGNGTLSSSTVPTQVGIPGRIASVAVESDTCYARGADGTTWHWGSGVDDANSRFSDMTRTGRALGALLSGSPLEEPEVEPVLRPTVVPGLPAVRSLEITMIDASDGPYSSGVRAVSVEGDLWEFGGLYRHKLKQVSGLRDVVATAADKFVSYAVQSDGTLWGWGGGTDESLGDGTDEYREAPVRIPVPGRVTSAVVNWGRRFALCSDGSVWAWGQNFGKLGIGSNSSDELSPVQVPGIQDAVSITSIRGSTFVVRRNGSLLSWGSNEDGQLGDGTTTDRAQPTTVTGIQGVADLKFSLAQVPRDASDRMATLMPYRDAISAYALTDRGQLWTWGNSESGRLGVSKAANSLTPQVVKTLPERVVQVVVEGTNGYAVTTAQRERRSWFSRSGRP